MYPIPNLFELGEPYKITVETFVALAETLKLKRMWQVRKDRGKRRLTPEEFKAQLKGHQESILDAVEYLFNVFYRELEVRPRLTRAKIVLLEATVLAAIHKRREFLEPFLAPDGRPMKQLMYEVYNAEHIAKDRTLLLEIAKMRDLNAAEKTARSRKVFEASQCDVRRRLDIA